ncbi:Shieldin complex subunit 2 [Dissophora globulifera]|nr:Shieldin complex subunit 2 [Dissophora globulifera]
MNNSESNDNDDGYKFAQQFVDPPLESDHWPTSPLYSGPSPPRQESPPGTSLESLSSSQLTPSSSLAVNLKKGILLAEVEAIRNNETAKSSSLARALHIAIGEAIAPSSSQTAAAAAAIPSPTFTTLARIKKEEPLTPELLMDDANTTATQVAIAAPILALDDSIAEIPVANGSSALDLSDSTIEPQALGAPVSLRASPPPPPPQLPVHLHQTQELFEVPQVLPLPSLIAEYTPKLTPIDEIKWPPAKAGRFHIFALVLSIGPEEQITTKTGQGLEKRQLVVCDQSATSFKLELWRERCRWGDQIKIGDAILFTDVQVKEYRLKVTGNTSGWSKMSRLDGSVLSSYISDNGKLGSYLRIFMDKRQILALDLLDKDKGIARDPSFYLTQAVNSLPSQSALTSANFNAASNPPTYSPRAGRGPKGDELISLLSTASAGTLYGAKSNMPVSYGTGMALKSSALLVGPDFNRARPRLPVTVTGTSIRASVVYRMLTVPGDESQGWEIGAVMSNGRFLKIQTPGSASWINDTTPGKLLHFFGRFQDKSEIFQIEASSREPYSLSENAWGSSVKRIEPRHFTSIRSLREHKFMGDATLNGYILAVNFPELAVNSNNSEHDDTETVDNERNMFDFIQCYCTGCHSPAVSSPQNPAILFCSFCHLDPQKSHAPLEWMYPAFELSLGDRPQMDEGSEGERLQLRCQLEIGDQVFWSVPARRWMQNEKGFWRSRRRWERLIELMNNEFKDNDVSGGVDRAGEVNLEGLPTAKGGKDMGVDRTRERGDVAGVEQIRASEQESTELRMRQRLSVEVRVGINMVTKALKVEYL